MTLYHYKLIFRSYVWSRCCCFFFSWLKNNSNNNLFAILFAMNLLLNSMISAVLFDSFDLIYKRQSLLSFCGRYRFFFSIYFQLNNTNMNTNRINVWYVLMITEKIYNFLCIEEKKDFYHFFVIICSGFFVRIPIYFWNIKSQLIEVLELIVLTYDLGQDERDKLFCDMPNRRHKQLLY